MSHKTYQWTGIDLSGKKTSGNINAKNRNHALLLLSEHAIAVLSIRKIQMIFSHAKKTSPKDRLDFTQQLQLFLQAGIPLSDALSLIANTSSHHAISQIIAQIKEKIISGMRFSAALQSFPAVFDPTYCQLIAAGEESGELEKVLTQIIDNLEQALHFKNKIVKALFYPISILIIAIVITIGLLIFVIPQFSAIYSNFNAQLPSMTRVLIFASNIIMHHTIEIICTLVIFILCLYLFYKKCLERNITIQNYLFLIPPYRSFVMTKEIAHWSRLLSITLQSNIPLSDALTIAHHVISNLKIQQQMTTVMQQVNAGKSLYAALDFCPYFPIRAKYLISAGENADALNIMMTKISLIYTQKLDRVLDHLSKLLEPVIMIAVASVISGLIIAMYLPIFRMGSVI